MSNYQKHNFILAKKPKLQVHDYWHGFYASSLSLRTPSGTVESFNPRLLIDDYKAGVDNHEETWYADTSYKFELDGQNFTGTFRHPKCLKTYHVDNLTDNTCHKCQQIPKCESFKKRLKIRKEERNISHIRNAYLTNTERSTKLQKFQSKIQEKESQVFLLTKEKERLLARRETLLQRIEEYAKRGSMKLVCHQLNRAAPAGT